MPTDIAAGFIGLEQLFSQRISDGNNWTVVRDAMRASTEAYNAAIEKMLTNFVSDVSKVKERFYQPASATLQPVDEWGRPKPTSGRTYYDVAFPLFMGAHAWGTNWVAREKMTVEEANEEYMAAQRADSDWQARHMLAALFFNNSYVFEDEEHGDLTIQSLARGEAAVKYPKANGGVFSSHTHYLAQAAAIADGSNPFPTIYTHLTEHPGNNGLVVVYVSPNDTANIEALASFRELNDPDVDDPQAATLRNVPTGTLADEIIGKANKCWIGTWDRIPDGYMLAHMTGTKILGRRQDSEAALRGFLLKEDDEKGLYQANFFRRSGFAVRNRVAALVMRIGNATYAPPADYAAMPLAI